MEHKTGIINADANIDNSKEVRFEVTGTIYVPRNLVPILNWNKDVIGYTLPDGREVQLSFCLELHTLNPPAGIPEYQSITDSPDMDALGFECVDFDTCLFQEQDED